MKDVSIAPTANNDVTITQYHVEYQTERWTQYCRAWMCPFHSMVGLPQLIPANGSGSVPFELVRQVAKNESPLLQITGSNVVTMIAEVTFFGHDQVGNDVSATGSTLINFRAEN